MIQKILYAIIFTISLTTPKLSIAQNFTNADFDGTQTNNLSGLPNAWQSVPSSDVNCFVSSSHIGLGDTPDLTDSLGPMSSTGISGNAYSGSTFVSGVRANNFHEGVMQQVNGLVTGNEYTLSFYQAVVKQQNCLDTSGAWTVILDNNILFNSPISVSNKNYDDKNLHWEYREINFIANSSSINFKFLPFDDDTNLDLYANELDGALRMGLDQVKLEAITYPTYIKDTLLCQNTPYTVQLNYPNAVYTWFDNSTNNSKTFNTSGSYNVKVETTDSIFNLIYSLDYFDVLPTDFPTDTLLCSGDVMSLYTPQTSNSFLWNQTNSSDSLIINSAGIYTYTQYEDHCYFIDTINVEYKGYPNLQFQDSTLCEGETIVFNLPHQFDYNWQDGTTDNYYEIETAGFYTLEITNEVCVESHQFEVNLIDTISFEGFMDTTLCFGESLNLPVPQGDFNAIWSDNSQGNLEITQSGNYQLNLYNYCASKTYSFDVEVLPAIEVNLGIDTSLCSPDSLILTPISNINQDFLWQDGSIQPSFVVTEAGIYTVEINLSNCTASDSIEIDYLAPMSLSLIADTSICSADDFILEADIQNAEFTQWNTGSNSNSIYVNTSGFYSVEAFNTCESIVDSVYIDVVECEKEVNLYAPNAFSPNGDIHNNSFKFVSDNEFDRFEWMVFNRWGELVFQANDINASWDGTHLNKICKDGTYVWKLVYSTSDSAYVEQKTGSISLLR